MDDTNFAMKLTEPHASKRLHQDIDEVLLGAHVVHADLPILHTFTDEMKLRADVLTSIMEN